MTPDPAFIAIVLVTFVVAVLSFAVSLYTENRLRRIERVYYAQHRKNGAIAKVLREIIFKVWPSGEK